MLGTDLVAACAARGFDVHSYDLPEFNITDAEHVRNVVETSDAVINCAAYTDVDGAETHAELAHRVNAQAVGCLGELARLHMAFLWQWVLHLCRRISFSTGRWSVPTRITTVPTRSTNTGASWAEKNCLPQRLLLLPGPAGVDLWRVRQQLRDQND